MPSPPAPMIVIATDGETIQVTGHWTKEQAEEHAENLFNNPDGESLSDYETEPNVYVGPGSLDDGETVEEITCKIERLKFPGF